VIETEIRRPPLSIDDLRGDWDALFRGTRREPSVSFEWSRALVRSRASERRWFLVILRRAGRVVGLVPMVKERERLFGRTMTVIQPMEEKYATHSDLLLAADDGELVGAFLDALASPAAGKWDVLQLSRLLEEAPLAGALKGELARRRVRHRWRLEQPSYYMPLPDNYTAYLASRSGKLRNYLKRAEKKLAAEGAVTFTRVQPGEPLDKAYDELLEIERDSWKHASGTSISTARNQEGFYRDLVETAGQAGTLHLTFLRLGGVAIAHNLGLLCGGLYFYSKTSYRQAYRPQGAASIGRARLIELLIAEGCTAVDFPGEPYEWEQQWTDTVRWHQSLLVFNRTMTGRVVGLTARVRDYFQPPSEDRTIVFSEGRGVKSGEAAEAPASTPGAPAVTAGVPGASAPRDPAT
jgi:CelD/BcsL family acetyltransferase involved in cellulose biosynthesis